MSFHRYMFIATFAGVGSTPYSDPRLILLTERIERDPLPGELVVIAPCMKVGELVYYCHCNDISKGD